MERAEFETKTRFGQRIDALERENTVLRKKADGTEEQQKAFVITLEVRRAATGLLRSMKMYRLCSSLMRAKLSAELLYCLWLYGLIVLMTFSEKQSVVVVARYSSFLILFFLCIFKDCLVQKLLWSFVVDFVAINLLYKISRTWIFFFGLCHFLMEHRPLTRTWVILLIQLDGLWKLIEWNWFLGRLVKHIIGFKFLCFVKASIFTVFFYSVHFYIASKAMLEVLSASALLNLCKQMSDFLDGFCLHILNFLFPSATEKSCFLGRRTRID